MHQVCKNWPGSIWEPADKRRLYCSRHSTMTKTKTLSKKKNYLRPFLQRTMGSPPCMALLLGVGSIMVAALRIGNHSQCKPTRHRSLVTSHQAVNFTSNRALGTRNQPPVTSHWSPVISHRSLSIEH